MHDLVSITALRRGEIAEVGVVVGTPERIRRLEELGVRSGSRLEMVRAGSPCIFRVAGTTLCFRDAELSAVMVRRRKTA